jgi:serine/threonine-protein kinase
LKQLGGWDALIGLVFTGLFFVLAALSLPFTESFEHKLYDLRLRALVHYPPSEDICLVAIDAPSIEAVGRWPWPRNVFAELLGRIAAGEPRALGCAVIFSEPDENQGLVALRELREEYQSLLEGEDEALRPLWRRLRKDKRYKKDVEDPPLGDLRGFAETMEEAAKGLDSDARLMETLSQTRRVLLAFYFRSL